MTAEEQKAIVVAVLREIGKVFSKAESIGDYVGFEERYEIDTVATLQGLGYDLELRAEQIEKGESEPLASDDDDDDED